MDTFLGANRNLQITPSSKVQLDTDDLYQSATGGTRKLNAGVRFAVELKLLKIVILCFFHNRAPTLFFIFFKRNVFTQIVPPGCLLHVQVLMKGSNVILLLVALS